jgi:hypothetical protein
MGCGHRESAFSLHLDQSKVVLSKIIGNTNTRDDRYRSDFALTDRRIAHFLFAACRKFDQKKYPYATNLKLL